jgi:hypothetical protein
MVLIRSNKPEHSGGDGGFQWGHRKKMFEIIGGKLQRRLEEKILIQNLR